MRLLVSSITSDEERFVCVERCDYCNQQGISCPKLSRMKQYLQNKKTYYEKDKVISEIKILVNQYNKLINKKSKPKYGLKPISFSAETGMITGEFHQITNYSIWEIFSADSLNRKLNTIWYDLNGLASDYATNYCGISIEDMDRINTEKEIQGIIEQYNTLVNQAKEKGKTKEGYLPINYVFFEWRVC